MRPSHVLLVVLMISAVLTCFLGQTIGDKRRGQEKEFMVLRQVVSTLGLSDLSLSTEARYTRHPAVSDPVVVSMDHPGAIDHFPSTLFWAPVR
ncbi:MAG: hypothetical protein WBB19_02345 [Desulforhopalus sp.]